MNSGSGSTAWLVAQPGGPGAPLGDHDAGHRGDADEQAEQVGAAERAEPDVAQVAVVKPLDRVRTSSGNGPMPRLPRMVRVSARNSSMPASVTMNAGMPKYATQ